MQISQVYKIFGINARQFKLLLERHDIVADLRVSKVVRPSWLAALVAEFGPLHETSPVSVNVAPTAVRVTNGLIESIPNLFTEATGEQKLAGLKIVGRLDATTMQKQALDGAVGLGNRSISNKSAHKRNGGHRGEEQPVDAALQLGQMVRIVEESGYGFLRKPGTTTDIFAHISNTGKTLPGLNEWVFFADGPNPRKEGKMEVNWARPVTQDAALLSRVAQICDDFTLKKLLEISPVEVRPEIAELMVCQVGLVNDADTLLGAVRTLERILKWAPNALPSSVDALLESAAPGYVWRLWLRYRSPLAGSPETADRLARLLEATPSIIESWWPKAEQEGLMGLCLAYALHDELSTSTLFELKSVLGPAQTLLYDAVLTRWFGTTGATSEDPAVFFGLREAARSGYEIAAALEEMVLAALTPTVALKAWLLDPTAVVFPRTAAVNEFDTLSPANQARAAAEFSEEEFVTVLGSVTHQSGPTTQKLATAVLKRHLLAALAAFGLDLESDRQSIKEIAWGGSGNWSVGKGAPGVATSLEDLRVRVSNGQPYLAVGHNICDFDTPILAKHGVALAANSLWDTLVVEMALSPDWRVFALDTKHAAEADAALALQLFQNQALRLLVMDEPFWLVLAPMFPPMVQAGLNELRVKRWGQWLTLEGLRLKARAYLRPQPMASTQLQQLREELAGNPARTKVVLAAQALWGGLCQESGMRFLNEEESEPDFSELQRKAVLNQLVLRPVEAVLAARFFDHCQQAQLAPVPANMAPAVRVRLQQHVTFADCRSATGPPDWQAAQCLCLTMEQLLNHHAQLRDLPELTVLVVMPDLITLGHKRLLLDGLNVQDLLASGRSRTEWVKFSGGQSFVGVTMEQVEELGVAVPKGYHRFWLEKHQRGSYRVWGSFDWEPLLMAFAPEVVRYIDTEETNFKIEQLSCVAVHAQRLQQRLGVTAFNPESIYRARYWLLQAELLASIGRRGPHSKPVVLLVQRGDELGKLATYFRKLGYYVPEPEKEAALVGKKL